MILSLFKRTNFKELFAKGALLLDVRNVDETAKDAVSGSVLIPLPELKNRIEELIEIDKPFVCVCVSGVRSGIAKKVLQKAGIEAYNGGSINKMRKYHE